jgi:hypothetical protein
MGRPKTRPATSYILSHTVYCRERGIKSMGARRAKSGTVTSWTVGRHGEKERRERDRKRETERER